MATNPDGSTYWAGTEAGDTGIFVRRLDPAMSVTHQITPACAGCSPLVATAATKAVVSGWYQGMLDLVPGGGGALSANGVDVFAAVLSPQAASFADAPRKSFGDNQPQRASALVTNAAGDAFLAGEVAGTMQAGGGLKVTSTGGLDAFAARFDASLSPVWLAGFGGGTTDQRATALALGSSLAVAGDFAGSLTASGVLLSAGGTDAFLLALDPASGAAGVALSFGGPGDDHAAGVAVDGSGHAVVAGVLGAPAFFGCGTLGGPGKSVFVAKRPLP